MAATCWITSQAVINIGAVIGLLPVTGIPLPFISFGGSSLVITMMAAGVLINVAAHEKPPTMAIRPLPLDTPAGQTRPARARSAPARTAAARRTADRRSPAR